VPFQLDAPILISYGWNLLETLYETLDAEGFSEEPIALPVEDFIDLHDFSPKEIPSLVEEYLCQAHQAGFREVRIIHGRGKGVQRAIVQSVLEKSPLVLSFSDAPPERGGWGATIAFLRSPNDS